VTTVGRWSLWTLAKLLVVALVVVVGASALVRDSRPAHASHTVLFVSMSSTCATSGAPIFVFVGGPSQDLFICVRDIDNSPWGAAGFNLEMKYVSWLVNITAVDIASPGYAGGWLGSTGRAVQCLPVTTEPNIATGQGRVYGGCQTVGTSPPTGPLSNTVLGKITMTPGIVKASTNLDLRGTVGQPTTATHLVSAFFDAQSPFGSVLIPAAVGVVQVFVAPCADYTGFSGLPDNFVSIFDILHLAQKNGRNSTQPGWNPNWDMNGDNAVNITQDVLIGAKQFGRTCPTAPPP